MDTDTFVASVYLKSTGEVSTLTSSDSDYQKIVQIGNMQIDAWANEEDSDWESLYEPGINIGTVTATDTYDLDSSINRISNQGDDWVQVTHTDGKTITNFQTVPAKRLKKYNSGHYCARVGSTLKFNKVFSATDAEYGGIITVPAYVFPSHLVNGTDIVPVDNPQWLVCITAAQWVQTDVTLAQNYANLVNEANALMTAMKQANTAQENTVDLGPVGISTRW